MGDMATLSLKVETDAGDSTAQLNAIAAAANNASTSLADVADSAGAFKSTLTGLAPTASQAASAFGSTASAAAAMAPALSVGMQGFNAYVNSIRNITPAVTPAVEAIGGMDRATVMFGASMLRLGSQLESGNVSFRGMFPLIKQLGLAMNEATSEGSILGKAFGGVASALYMSVPAFLGAGVAAAAAAAAILYLGNQAATLDRTIGNLGQGVDKGMGLTVAGFRSASAAAATAAGISTTAAQTIGESLAKAGVMGDAGMQQAIVSITKFAALTGTTAPQATELLVAALKDPVEGLEKLNAVYQVADEAQSQFIASLVSQNKMTQAAAQVAADYAQAVANGSVQTGLWAEAMNNAKTNLSSFGEGIATAENAIGGASRSFSDWIHSFALFQPAASTAGESMDLGAQSTRAWNQILGVFGVTLKETSVAQGSLGVAAETAAQQHADDAKTVANATREYGKSYESIVNLQKVKTAFENTVASGITLDEKQVGVLQKVTAELDKERAAYNAAYDAANKQNTGVGGSVPNRGGANSPAAAAAAADKAKKSTDEYAVALDNLAKKTADYSSASLPAQQAANAEAAAYSKAMAATQGLADAIEWLNSPLRQATEATSANARAIDALTASSQALEDAKAMAGSTLRAEIQGNNAATGAVNALIQAQQSLANSIALKDSPQRTEIEQTNMLTSANQKAIAAGQQLAIMRDEDRRSTLDLTAAQEAARQKQEDALYTLSRTATQYGNTQTSATNYSGAIGGISSALGSNNGALGSNNSALAGNTAQLNANTAAAQANAAARSASASSGTAKAGTASQSTATLNSPAYSADEPSYITSERDAGARLDAAYAAPAGTSSTSSQGGGATDQSSNVDAAYAKGGSFTVVGQPGIDTNLVAMWLTAGEKVIIKPVGSFSGGGEYMRDAGGYWTNPSGRTNVPVAGGINPATTTAEMMSEQGYAYVSDPTTTTSSSSADATAAAATLATAMQTATSTFATALTAAAETLATAQENAATTYAASIASSLATEITALQAIAKPVAPTAPDASSAGATVASAPSAYGSDKNASTFYDPNSRKAYMSQFGIQGDEATQKATQAYNLQMQQYHTELSDYELAQKTLAQLGDLGLDVTTGLSAVQTIIKTAADAQIAAGVTATASLTAAFAAYASSLASANTTASASVSSANAQPQTKQVRSTTQSAASISYGAAFAQQHELDANYAQEWQDFAYPMMTVAAAGGGDFMVQGAPGRDANLVKLALTAGELVSVKTPSQQAKAAASHSFSIVINTPDAASFQKSRASIVAKTAQMVQAATRNRAGAS